MRVNPQARGWARYLYSDDQPRDDDGKWTDGGGSSVSSKSPGPVREIQYRGGVEGHTARVQYSTRNQKMAESYVDMSNDRFGSGAALHRVQVQIQRPAPASEIETIAKSIGIDNEFNTPASVFDSELHGRESVDRLVNELERRGYDGAILPDIAYGTEIEDDAFISFQKPKVTAPAPPVKTPVRAAPAARTFPKIEERRRHERIRARAIANREQRLKERRERLRRERLRSKGKFLEARNLYSDDQPRDDDGKWTDGGGSTSAGKGPESFNAREGTDRLSTLPVHPSKFVAQQFQGVKTPLTIGGEVLNELPGGFGFNNKAWEGAWTKEREEIQDRIASKGNYQDWLNSASVTEERSLSDLQTFQTWVGSDKVKDYIAKYAKEGVGDLAKGIVVVRYKGKDWLADGNHRAAALLLSGVNRVNVRIYDLE